MKRNLTLLMILALRVQILFAQEANLVKNGTFEMGNTGFKTDYNLLSGRYENGEYSVTDNVTTVLYSKNFKNPFPPAGQFLFINAFTDPRTDKRCWYDSIYVQPNTTYIFSCSVASVINLDPPRLLFKVNGNSVSQIFYISGSNYWQIIGTTYTTKSDEARIEISIVDVNKESRWGNDFAIDNIFFGPEKGTPPVKKEEKTVSEDLPKAEPSVVITPKPVKKDTATQIADFKKDISIDEVKIDQKLQLKNVYFERGKYNLLPTTFHFPELNDLVSFMKKYPSIRVRLEGHTDNQGNPQLNLELSENRAKEVKKYLVDQGIDESRIEWIGYGGQKPANSNATEELRQRNRRVEVVIIGK